MKKLLINNEKIMIFIIIFCILFVDKRSDLINCFFNVPISFNLVAVLIIFILTICLIIRKKIKYDIISISLLILLIYYNIQFIFIGGYNNNLFYFVDLYGCFLVYQYFRNTESINIQKQITMCTLIFGSILSIQVYLTRIILYFQKINPNIIKGFLQVPIGGSNYIASFLLIAFVTLFLLKVKESSLIIGRKVVLSMIVFAILVTNSDGAMLALFAFLLGYSFIKYKNIIINLALVKKYYRFIKYSLIFIGIFLFASILYFIMKLTPETIEILSSGRLSIYFDYLKAIQHNIVFGWGFYFERIIGDLAHNWTLSNLLYGGIIGLFLATFPLLTLLFWNIKRGWNKYTAVAFCLFIVVLFHGQFEPNLFTIKFDFLFWMIIGLILNLSNFEYKVLNMNYYKAFICIKNKKLLVSITFIGLLVVISLQYFSLPMHYQSIQTIKVTPYSLNSTDVYSLDATSENTYNQLILKKIRQSSYREELINEFPDDLSYKDTLSSIYINLRYIDNTFEINVQMNDKNLSATVCKFTSEYVKKIIQENNSKDKIVVNNVMQTNIHGESYVLVIFFDIILATAFVTFFCLIHKGIRGDANGK